MATSDFKFFGGIEQGYSAQHKRTLVSYDIDKNAEGLWIGTFHGRPRHPRTGLRCGTGMCPKMKTVGTFKTRLAAAVATHEQFEAEQAQPLGT